MANEPLGIFEELQEKRALVEQHLKRTRRRCISMGPASNGAYAEPHNPFNLDYRLARIGEAYHSSRNPNYRLGRSRAIEGELGIDICRVLQAVVLAHGIPLDDMLFSMSHRPNLTLPRHVAMWLIDRYCPDYSRPQVAYLFRRDHTTVLYAVRAVEERIRQHDCRVTELIAQARERMGVP